MKFKDAPKGVLFKDVFNYLYYIPDVKLASKNYNAYWISHNCLVELNPDLEGEVVKSERASDSK